jgi:hypothetical protein
MQKKIGFLLSFGFFLGLATYAAVTPYYAKKAQTAPVLDADSSDACWAKAAWSPIDQVWIAPAATSTSDYTGRYKCVWTPEKIYFLVEITDDQLNYKGYVKGSCNEIHNFDCIEIFLDENHSGGDHQYNYNAFAYHINENGDVCDNGTDRQMHLFNNDVQSTFDTIGKNLYLWEVSFKIFNDKYVYGGNNTPEVLTENKLLGMSIAYNDNDGGNQRQSMFGSAVINLADKNVSWINASYFGTMQLIDSVIPPLDTRIASPKILDTNWNVLNNNINFNFADNYVGNVTSQLIDITGKTVNTTKIYKSSTSLVGSYEINNIPKGVYFLQVTSGSNYYTSKILVN